MSRFLSPGRQSLTAYTPGEQPGEKLIKLNTNESPYPPSPEAVRALSAGALERCRLYSDIPARDLCQATAQYYGVSPENVLYGNGSDEILAFAFQAFGQGGVSFPDVTYGFYPVWAQLYALPMKVIPVKEDFTIDPGEYRGGGLIVIANPNAPTGISLPLEAIQELAAANPDTVVLIDEAYVDFGGESAVALVPRYENLLVTQTFSKSRSLAGARLGFAIAQPSLIQDLNRIKYAYNPYNVGTPAQLMGAAAMRDRAYFEATRRAVMDTRERVRAELLALGFTIPPSAANFLFARPPGISGEAMQKALRERGILVRRFDAPRIRDFLRISIGAPEEMEMLTNAIKAIVEERA
ncbi:MAG: histidinol-phosphate transaminase [Candidatus Limiplasma sp.]|nr:histidinol-phosphate transaminase [Candidatus Limiplasma sp.]